MLKHKDNAFKNNISFHNIYETNFSDSNKNFKVSSNFSIKSLDLSKIPGPGPNTQSKCTNWYWVTTYSDGSQTWLYLFSTCDSDGMTFEPDGSGEGNTTNEDLQNQFNNYTLSTSTPSNINLSTSNDGPDPVTGIISWSVARGLISSWNITANTQYGYYHYIYSTPTFFEHQFNITNYQTISSSYNGSNTFITSTWTQTGVNDQINYNNSANAYGSSQVLGTIKHRSNFTISNPLGGGTITLEKIEPVNGSTNIYPH